MLAVMVIMVLIGIIIGMFISIDKEKDKRLEDLEFERFWYVGPKPDSQPLTYPREIYNDGWHDLLDAEVKEEQQWEG